METCKNKVLIEVKITNNIDVGGDFIIHVYMNGKQKNGYWSNPKENKEDFLDRIIPKIKDEWGHYGEMVFVTETHK